MTTIWLKAAYTRQDRDSKTGELVPGAVAPGLYCKDAASFEAFKEGIQAKGKTLMPGIEGPGYEGLTIRIATPEQDAMFEARAAEGPAPRRAVPSGNRRTQRVAAAKARRRA